MNIHLHVSELVLEGIELDGADERTVRDAVVSELARLLEEKGIGPTLQSGGALAALSGGSLTVCPCPGSFGRAIGQAVHAGLGQ